MHVPMRGHREASHSSRLTVQGDVCLTLEWRPRSTSTFAWMLPCPFTRTVRQLSEKPRSKRRSTCMRSCALLSVGRPGRLRTTRIPSDTHQADSGVSPRARASTRTADRCRLDGLRQAELVKQMLEDRPNVLGPRSLQELHRQHVATEPVPDRERIASRSIFGAPPSLKSTVHRSFGSVGIRCAGAAESPPDCRRSTGCCKPASRSTRATVTMDGTVMPGCLRAMIATIFFGLHRGCSLRSCTIERQLGRCLHRRALRPSRFVEET
jgi:hypothetical protein